MPSALVVARDIVKVYRIGAADVTALEACSFEIAHDDRIALVGPSGSGKSTLLHCIGGLDEPTSGSITWPDLGERRSLRPAKISLIFQGQSLVPELSAVENVELPLLMGGTLASSARAAARDALALVDLASLEAKLPQELSIGQAQRVAAARALVSRPRLILADEPTGQLDRETGAHLIDALIAAAVQSGAALVIATHDGEIAARMSAQWRLDRGRLLAAELVR
jgi:ABC-type lipoprotein export system ATPase subunit